MKVKAIKPHYYQNSYILPGVEYRADKPFAEMVIRRGICESLEPELYQKDLSRVLKEEIEDKDGKPIARTKKRPARRRKTRK